MWKCAILIKTKLQNVSNSKTEDMKRRLGKQLLLIYLVKVKGKAGKDLVRKRRLDL